MLRWNWYGNGWNHAAYWGEDLDTSIASRKRIGNLPPAGVWTRLEVPAWKLGITSLPISGIGVTAYDGDLWWDRPGTMSCTLERASAPTLGSEVVWFEDALPPGATSYSFPWTPSQSASGTMSHTQTPQGSYYGHYFSKASPVYTLVKTQP